MLVCSVLHSSGVLCLLAKYSPGLYVTVSDIRSRHRDGDPNFLRAFPLVGHDHEFLSLSTHDTTLPRPTPSAHPVAFLQRRRSNPAAGETPLCIRRIGCRCLPLVAHLLLRIETHSASPLLRKALSFDLPPAPTRLPLISVIIP